jgi:hypothetical protein
MANMATRTALAGINLVSSHGVAIRLAGLTSSTPRLWQKPRFEPG